MGWDRVVEGITSTFEALCENENEMIVLDIFAARAFCIRVATGRDRMGVKSMIDLVLVKRDLLNYIYDVKTVRRLWSIGSNVVKLKKR